jgi:hypothetical protein
MTNAFSTSDIYLPTIGGVVGDVTATIIPTWIQFILANYLANFHVAAILAIST